VAARDKTPAPDGLNLQPGRADGSYPKLRTGGFVVSVAVTAANTGTIDKVVGEAIYRTRKVKHSGNPLPWG
jgi:hypothetical protein